MIMRVGKGEVAPSDSTPVRELAQAGAFLATPMTANTNVKTTRIWKAFFIGILLAQTKYI
jgi:hypothetical protein